MPLVPEERAPEAEEASERLNVTEPLLTALPAREPVVPPEPIVREAPDLTSKVVEAPTVRSPVKVPEPERRRAPAPLLALFERRPQINVLARARTPHLAAWAATGRDFSFEYAGRTHVLRNVATNDVEFGDSAGLLRRDGQVSVWSTGELTDAAELIAVAEQAAQILSLTQAFATIAR